jgi:hypothetical protein
MIEIQLAFKQKNTELFEKNKMLEKQLSMQEKNIKRDLKPKPPGSEKKSSVAEEKINIQMHLEKENELNKQIHDLQKENDLLKVIYFWLRVYKF